MDRDQEKRLVNKARKDPEAFGQLYDAYFPKILSYAYRRLGELSDAEEAASETFFKALRGIGRFRWRGGGFLPWLYRIAGNEVVNIHRKRGKGEQSTQMDLLPGPVRNELEDAEEAYKGYELAQSLADALSRLERKDQEVVALHYLQGETYGLIAESMGMKEGAVRVRSMRALRKLQDILRKEGWDNGKARDAGWAASLSGSGARVPGLPETATTF